MTQVTIIIHEGRGGQGPAGRLGRRHGMGHGRPDEQTEERGHRRQEHGQRPHGHGHPHEHTETRAHPGRGHGHRHEHGEHPRGYDHHGRGHGRPDEHTEQRRHHRHDPHAPANPTDEQRQLARRLRRQMRHIMQEAEAAGLSPERVERIVRREGRRSYL